MTVLLEETESRALSETAAICRRWFTEHWRSRAKTLLLLDGEMGAGKTAFVRSLGAALEISANINSPTFNLLNIYESSASTWRLFHYDLYRIQNPSELDELDFAERWAMSAGETREIHAIEWWSRAKDYLPAGEPRYLVEIQLPPDPAGEEEEWRGFRLSKHEFQ